jgi:protein FAM50
LSLQEDEDVEAAAAGKPDDPVPSGQTAAAVGAAVDGEGPSTSGRVEGPAALVAAAAEGEEEPSAKRSKLGFGKLGKDPTVKTDFLPDKDRELLEEELRQQLKKVG